jgi:1-acyl-sn-glycerol-3-phosphate acyltransferase
LRVAWRIFLILPLSLVLYVVLIVGTLVIGVSRGLGLRRTGTRPWRASLQHLWARLVAATLRMRISVEGRPPTSPFFLVSNHLGYIDIVLLAARLRCVFVAKSEVASWPVLGLMCRSAGTLFIDRTSKRDIPRVMSRIDDAMRAGMGVIVFPEGTSSAGADVLPFRPSLLQPAAGSATPVSYAAITYRTPPGSPPAHRSVCWWGDAGFAGHLLGLLRLPSFDARIVFGAEPVRSDDRKNLAVRLRDAVRAAFDPVVREEQTP